MALPIRQIVVTRLWPRPDSSGVAVRSQDGVRGSLSVTNLLGLDKFYGLAGKPQYDWPNPRGAQRAVSLLSWMWPAPVIGVYYISPAIIAQYDWPVPASARRPIELRTWLNPVNLNLLSQDAFFGLAGNPNFDWPVPKGAIPGIALRTWAHPVPIILISKDRFFGLAGNPNFDWPVPKGAKPGVSLRTWMPGTPVAAYTTPSPEFSHGYIL